MSPDETRDAELIADLIETCRRIIVFTREVEESGFYSNAQTKYATLYQILILGEAVKRLSAGIRDRHSDVPWQDIAGMWDRLIHTYVDINLGEVWRTSRNDVPALLERLLEIAKEFHA